MMMNRVAKNRAILVACALVLVAALAVISVSAIVSANPYNQVIDAFENSAKASLKNEGFLQAQKSLSGGSVTVSGNMSELIGQIVGMPLDIGAEAKLYVDAEKRAMAAEASVLLGDEPLLDGNVYLDTEQIVLACAALFGDTVYGVDLTKLEENFANSVFGPEGEYSIGLDEEDIAEFFNTMTEQEDMRRDAEQIVRDTVAVFVKSLKKHAEVDSVKDAVTVAGKSVKTNAVTITLDGRTMTAIVEDMIKYLDTNKDIENFIDTYADVIAANAGLDADDLLDDYKDAVDDAKDMIDDFSESVEDIEIEFEVAIAKSTKEVVALAVRVEDDRDTILDVDLLCGPDWSEMTELTLEVEIDGSELKVVYLIEKDTKEEFRSSITVTGDGEELASLKLSHEKQEGDFKATLRFDGEEFILRGTLTTKGKKTTVVLKSITIDEEKLKLGDITVVVNTADKMPAPAMYTDVLTLKAGEVEDILAEIEEIVEEMGTAIMTRLLGGLQ